MAVEMSASLLKRKKGPVYKEAVVGWDSVLFSQPVGWKVAFDLALY